MGGGKRRTATTRTRGSRDGEGKLAGDSCTPSKLEHAESLLLLAQFLVHKPHCQSTSMSACSQEERRVGRTLVQLKLPIGPPRNIQLIEYLVRDSRRMRELKLERSRTTFCSEGRYGAHTALIRCRGVIRRSDGRLGGVISRAG